MKKKTIPVKRLRLSIKLPSNLAKQKYVRGINAYGYLMRRAALC
jgi:hypothetical protein